ncbi:ethanolamine ammonia-lyase subunit EutC [Nocardia sp. NEAU-G5]|uniref:Ethanolamine ammonia-lyase small subunit n=1 Tax=Nocardia albiluteola TaxID=2842303 RepID=A0ABS6AUU0_9NOCA|nr:ethanolamine ammonia-lyase subunit EutC [Nocardia albiluteola]MBU3061016.1 ethanolamine ammonia-lyase subunit EutC [Nocardia albiluteola]
MSTAFTPDTGAAPLAEPAGTSTVPPTGTSAGLGSTSEVPPISGAAADDLWRPLRAHTRARIGLRRAGDTLATTEVLALRASHALARDAVRTALDTDALRATLAGLGLSSPVHVRSAAGDRDRYLRRPDLGRTPADLTQLAPAGADLALVVCDGLSATAVHDHAAGLCAALVREFMPDYSFAPPVLATQARVALGDHIGQALGVRVVLVVIGERPGLSVADSLGIYLTYQPRPGRVDSERNCISNIHPPDGLGYTGGAVIARDLVDQMIRTGRSGVSIKARAAPTLPPGQSLRITHTPENS